MVAGPGNRVNQRAAAGTEKIDHAVDLGGVLGRADDLLARAETHRHLAVNAAWVIGRGNEVLLAAAHLEQVEEAGLEALGESARTKRSKVDASGSAEVGHDVAAREFVG